MASGDEAVATQVIGDPRGLDVGPREKALAGIASLVTEAPWTVDAGDLDRLRAAGLRDDEIVQAVTIAAVFNHLTRAADATGVEPDYASALPRMVVDAARDPLPRPPPDAWPTPAPRLPLSLRPALEEALVRWRSYARTPTPRLSARDRAVLARTSAHGTCDAAGVAEHAEAVPGTPREQALAAFAERLTLTPWRMRPDDLDALRAHGLDDRSLLEAIAVVGFQNMESRVRLALGNVAGG